MRAQGQGGIRKAEDNFMFDNRYSAGLVSQSFWFIEIKKVIRLLNEGKTEAEIQKECIDENLFCMPNEYRSKRTCKYIWKRIKSLDAAMLDLFMRTDLSTQKVINLIAVLKCDRLFFEFIYEVYREKIILGIHEMKKSDVNSFFRNKEIQSTDVARWTDATKCRLGAIYLKFLADSNLLNVKGREKIITPPIPDCEFVRCLTEKGWQPILKAITGAV